MKNYFLKLYSLFRCSGKSITDEYITQSIDSIKKKSFIVSFPRSGSNFLQACMRDLCNIPSKSLYIGTDLKSLMNLKSHAPSPRYLFDEMKFICSNSFEIDRIYLLQRDPRDVMISFYEFFNSRCQGTVLQHDFLNVDWFLAFQTKDTVKSHLRSTHHFPMSISKAFKTMISEWYSCKDPVPGVPIRIFKYEDFVFDKTEILLSISNDHNCNFDAINDKINIGLVSLYSKEKRLRGAAYGWKDDVVFHKYKTLISEVEKTLHEEIDTLRYT